LTKVSLITIFGKGASLKIIVSSILFSTLIFFYILTIGSFFGPTTYPLINRVTYATPFVDKYFIDKYYDSFIILLGTTIWLFISICNRNLKIILLSIYGISALMATSYNVSILSDILTLSSIPIILTLLIINKIWKYKLLNFSKILYINYIAIIGFVIGAISITITLVHIIYPDLALPPVNYLYYIYLLFSIFSPILLILIAITFPLKILIGTYIRKIPIHNITTSYKTSLSQHSFLSKKRRILLLSFIILISVSTTVIPHLNTVNKDKQIIGTDTNAYAKLLNSLIMTKNTSELFQQVFLNSYNADRSFSLVVFFLYIQAFGNTNLINSIEYLPLILGPILIIVIYFLTLELTAEYATAILASFLTITSFHILVGTYAGLYADWLSLIFGYLGFLFLIRSLKKPRKVNIILFSALMIILLLCHAPTWTILSIVSLIFLTAMLKLKTEKKSIIYLFLAMLPSIFIDIARLLLIKSSGVLQDITFANNQGAGLQNTIAIWDNLTATSQIYLAGQFGNSIILVLVLYWLFRLNTKEKYNILIPIFFSLLIFPFLFGERVIQARVMYDIPFQIPAAIALMYLRKYYGNVIIFTVCSWLFIIAIRTISNFYFIRI
jgi:hypothetical protein